MARNRQTIMKGRNFEPSEDLSIDNLLLLITAGAGPGATSALLSLGLNKKVCRSSDPLAF